MRACETSNLTASTTVTARVTSDVTSATRRADAALLDRSSNRIQITAAPARGSTPIVVSHRNSVQIRTASTASTRMITPASIEVA